jgi:hypothetical protein
MPPRPHVFRRRFFARLTVATLAFTTLALASAGEARAQLVPSTAADPGRSPSLPPTAVNTPFIQYGVAFSTEFVASSDALCSNDSKVVPHCILGSGAGLVFPRVGWRSEGHWYIGGAYEFSKQDASTVYLLPILQQLRGEARFYFLEGQLWTPFVEGDLGVAGYGNEWTVDAYGPDVSFAIGVEAQISRRAVVGATLAYRLLHLGGFTDTAQNERQAGFTQLLGLNVLLEVRDPY